MPSVMHDRSRGLKQIDRFTGFSREYQPLLVVIQKKYLQNAKEIPCSEASASDIRTYPFRFEMVRADINMVNMMHLTNTSNIFS